MRIRLARIREQIEFHPRDSAIFPLVVPPHAFLARSHAESDRLHGNFEPLLAVTRRLCRVALMGDGTNNNGDDKPPLSLRHARERKCSVCGWRYHHSPGVS